MKRSGFALFALATIVFVVLVAGCEGGTASTGPDDGKTLVMFTITETGATSEGTETKVGSTTQVRDVGRAYDVEASDDRLAGEAEMVLNGDMVTDENGDSFGTLEITNDGGTWEGTYQGANGKYGWFMVHVLKGTGDYDGLTARVQSIEADTMGITEDVTAVFTGWIEGKAD